MTFDSLQPEGIAEPIAPYSPVIVSGDLVVLAGQIPFDEDGKLVSADFAEQGRRVFENIGSCLRAANCDYSDVIKVTTYLASFDDLTEYNALYTEYFKPPYPARTTVQAGLYGFAIEIDALARKRT
jgi:2-iminobutanoate/2-iminopropanoate deaminase